MTDVALPADVPFPADGFALFPDRSVVALRVNGELKDLATVVDETDAVEPVTIDSPDGLGILRHSTAHVLAQAVQRINPQANLGIGPPITDGFYYDFGVEHPFSTEDLKAIDKEMARIIREGQRFVRRVVTDDEARAELVDEPFKLELIGLKGGGRRGRRKAPAVEVGAGELTIYDNVNRDGETVWKDLCRGPHLPEHPPDRQRLGAHPRRRRLLAREREEPAAAAHLRHRLADQGRAARLPAAPRRGRQARPPQARPRARPVLVPRRDRLGPVGLAPARRRRPPGDGAARAAPPRRRRLHLRLHAAHLEAGPVPAVEPPRHLQGGHVPAHPPGRGARRARRDHQARRRLLPEADELPDAHPDLQGARAQLPRPADAPRRERHGVPQRALGRPARPHPRARLHPGRLAPVRHSRAARGGDDPRARVRHLDAARLRSRASSSSSCRCATTRRRSGSARDEFWDYSTNALRNVALASGLKLTEVPGEAAFYGPKIDLKTKDAIGRTWQLSTVQVDPNLPERFELEYTDRDGQKKRPIMIHRALFGSIERFFAILLEHYAGAFPVWLSPVQVVGIPVAEEYADYLGEVIAQLTAEGRPRRARPQRRPDAEEDPHAHHPQGAAHADRRRAGPRRRARCRSGSATARRRTACRSPTRCAASARPSPRTRS